MRRSTTGRAHPRPSPRGAVTGVASPEAPATGVSTSAAGAGSVAGAVKEGLGSRPKWLPPWLFYDAEGSRLFEKITTLPEYYLTRAETAILAAHGAPIVRAALAGRGTPPGLSVMELGAGTATKTQILLAAAVAHMRPWGGRCSFVPVDISRTVLIKARARLAAALPDLIVRPVVGDHEAACAVLAKLPRPRLVLFLGSSIGNFDDASNIALFNSVRNALDPGDAFILGADRRNPVEEILAAYDDAAGVTAAFNRNILVRINRELDGGFDPMAFDHVARWNEAESRVEMHLQSLSDQRVPIGALGMTVRFRRGETIHTESSVKYTDDRIRAILDAARFRHERSWFDARERFGLHLARAAS